jgi:hypothetical protein
MIDVHTLLETILNTSMKSACFIDEAFFFFFLKQLILGLLSSSDRLPLFLNFQISD